MIYKSDLYDNRLLYELDKDSSQGISALANKLRRSKPFILYRMKKLEEAGVITGYHAIVDMSKLGYFTFRVYFKTQGITEAQGKEFVEHIKSGLKQVWTITSMHGKWDYALFLGVKTIAEFHEIWDDIMLSFKKNIKSYNVAVYAPIYNFNRKFFLEHESKENVERVYGIGNTIKLDNKDLKLLEAYANNVRQSSIELAEKVNLSAETVRSRIKKLEKEKVIVGYKLGLGLEPLGFTSYRVDLQLKSTHQNKAIFDYCRIHNNIYQINKSIGGADFEMEVIVRDLSHLLQLIDELKQKFKEAINDVEYFSFSTFHILKYIPD